MQLSKPGGLDKLQLVETDIPRISDNEILVKVAASSLNYHDLLVALGSIPTEDKRVLLGDASGQVVDIGDLVGIACGNLVTPLVNSIKGIVAGADPEYQPIMRNNIILAGGGSLIEGLADAVAEGLADIGDVSVWCAENPVTKVAEGALTLAGDMPDDQFTSIN